MGVGDCFVDGSAGEPTLQADPAGGCFSVAPHKMR